MPHRSPEEPSPMPTREEANPVMTTKDSIRLRFLEEVHPQNPNFRPLRAALLLAQADEPGLALVSVERVLAGWARGLRLRLDADRTPYQKLSLFNRFFFQERGFRRAAVGETGLDAIHPHRVLAGRRGRDLSLVLLYLDLAERAGVPVRALSFPGQIFLASEWLGEGSFIDVAAGGRILGTRGLQSRLRTLFSGHRVLLRPRYLTTISGRRLLERYMVMLAGVYLDGRRPRAALRLADWRLFLDPASAAARLERALILYELNRFEAADRDFSAVLGRPGFAEPSARVDRRAAVSALLADFERALREV